MTVRSILLESYIVTRSNSLKSSIAAGLKRLKIFFILIIFFFLKKIMRTQPLY
jgi:hypothetical protein